MKNSKLEFKTSDEAESVYYEAFMHCDKEVMAALWADGDVVCIHPGSVAIVGYVSVLRSWSHIFSNANRPEFTFTVLKKTQANGMAVHLVAEEFTGSKANATMVLATNVYQLFDSGWLMIEHHASLVQSNQRGQTLQ